jgi:hypothetical protein
VIVIDLLASCDDGDSHINKQIPAKPYFTKNVQNGV